MYVFKQICCSYNRISCHKLFWRPTFPVQSNLWLKQNCVCILQEACSFWYTLLVVFPGFNQYYAMQMKFLAIRNKRFWQACNLLYTILDWFRWKHATCLFNSWIHFLVTNQYLPCCRDSCSKKQHPLQENTWQSWLGFNSLSTNNLKIANHSITVSVRLLKILWLLVINCVAPELFHPLICQSMVII